MRAERLYHFLGICGLAATFVFAVIGGYGAMMGIPDAGFAGGACAMVFLIPSVVFLFYSQQKTAIDGNLKELADVLRGYRSISMDELAAKMHANPKEAELLVAACLGRGYIRGSIDSASKVFTLDSVDERADAQTTRR